MQAINDQTIQPVLEQENQDDDSAWLEPPQLVTSLISTQEGQLSGDIGSSSDFVNLNDLETDIKDTNANRETPVSYMMLPYCGSVSETPKHTPLLGYVHNTYSSADYSDDGESFCNDERSTYLLHNFKNPVISTGSANRIVGNSGFEMFEDPQSTQAMIEDNSLRPQIFLEGCIENEHNVSYPMNVSPLGLVVPNIHELEMISAIQDYIRLTRNSTISGQGLRTTGSPSSSTDLQYILPKVWKFYCLGFSAAINSASCYPERQQIAQKEWDEAVRTACVTFQYLTERLLGCLLLLYINTYTENECTQRSHQANFRFLCKLAKKLHGPLHPLTRILDLLVRSGPS